MNTNNILRSKDVGTITEYQCAIYLMKLGCTVSTPIGDNAQYDLLIDVEHQIFKVQCKHGSIHDGSISINCTTNINTRTRLETKSYSHSDVDFFATFYQDTCYLIPFDHEMSSFCLRIDNPKNNVKTNIHWLENYEASYILTKILHPEIVKDNTEARRNLQYKTVDTNKHYRWITNGNVNKKLYDTIDNMPEGFYLGRCGKCNQFT